MTPIFLRALDVLFLHVEKLTPRVTLLDLMMDIQYLVLTKSAKKDHINE